MGNVTLVSTDSQEVMEQSLTRFADKNKTEEPKIGEVAPEKSDETEVEAPATTEDTEEEHEEDPQKLSKRSQKIKRLASKLTEAERERDEWRTKFEEVRRGREEQPKTEETTVDPHAYPVPKPKAADFADPQEFVEALTEWKVDEREYRNAVKAHEEDQRAEQKEVFDAYNLRVAEAKGDIEDFEQVVSKSPLKIWPEVQTALLMHEKGPEIVYYLAKNPEVAEKLAEMSPSRAVVELGTISANLNKKAPVSAPKPKPQLISPVGGTTRVEVDRKNMSWREYREGRKNGTIK